ncbi:MAG: hypothetical protein R3F62_21620 [Planctomycetota bacterium]
MLLACGSLALLAALSAPDDGLESLSGPEVRVQVALPDPGSAQ